MMNSNRVKQIQSFGQSIWLDYLRRGMIESGELGDLIENDGLRGVTSNPAIFEKAIDGSDDYTAAVHALAEQGRRVEEIYRTLTVEDVRQAADLFRPIYDETEGRDGFVSLEVSPHLARDTEGTVKEARELWTALNRPNVLIKVPGTREGLPAIRTLIAEGINVNVTLLFGLRRYREVAEAYITGLEDRLAAGEPIDRVASVASFFLSRIDVKVDPMIEKVMDGAGEDGETASQIHGKVAVASARVAYQMYREIFEGERFRKLADRGAGSQRVLWASTSTKNPDYSDVKYVEALIGPETVNTIPQETLNAYRDHGHPEERIQDQVDRAHETLRQLAQLGIDLDEATEELIDEGIRKFEKPYDRTMESLRSKMQESRTLPINGQELLLGEYQELVDSQIHEAEKDQYARRLWRKDPTLWNGRESERKSIPHALGWLHVAEKMLTAAPQLMEFAAEIRKAGFKHVVHMGMGGSSLAPLVFQRTFEVGSRGLPVTVLDTTDPATIRNIENEIPLEDTLFIVASKSGTTAEPLAFMDYFYDRVAETLQNRAGDNFVAITDPNTPLVKTARERRFRAVFLNYGDIGGRYSALSYFGMLPAALMGLDIGELLERAIRMANASGSCRSVTHNPGVMLGTVLGDLARRGRDKLTFLMPPSLVTFGMWLEQLLAESTGKEENGILPVVDENIGDPSVYDRDRVFVHIALDDDRTSEEDRRVRELARAGHPVVVIRMADLYDLAQEMMRWEIATAIAGSVIGINAFNQPNVQESKDNTNRLLKQVQDDGRLPADQPTAAADGLSIFATVAGVDIQDLVTNFVSQAREGDYVAFQAYLTEKPETERALQEMRHELRDHTHLATTVGYGPRYLHSTGQYHKGGPNTGLFIQLTASSRERVEIPDRGYTFGEFIRAQAEGDLEALRKHDRRVMRIDLGDDVAGGLKRVKEILNAAMHVAQ